MTQCQFLTYVCTGSNTSDAGQRAVHLHNIMVNVQNYTDFASASTSCADADIQCQRHGSNTWSYNTGNPGDIVVVQVMYQWPIVLGPLGLNLSNLSNGNRLLVSTAVFKNEPY